MFLLKQYKLGNNEVKITGYGEVEDRSQYGEDLYIEVNQPIYNFIKENINRNDIICSLVDGGIVLDRITLIPKDELNNMRNIVIKTYRKHFVDRYFDSEFYVTFFSFIVLNNKLSSKGFFVTDENREDVYLDIINTNDEKLIDLLDEYLVIMDEISEYEVAMNNFSDFKNNVNNLMEIDEIKKLFKIETNVDFDVYYHGLGGDFNKE